MFKLIIKLLIICLITQKTVICLQSESEDYSDDGEDVSTGSLETEDSTESSEDYEEAEREDREQTQSFLDKFRQIHSENKNATFRLNVKHINETFELINDFQQKLGYFFKSDGKTGLEFIEFLSEIDIRLSSDCMAALFRIYASIQNTEFWSIKCE